MLLVGLLVVGREEELPLKSCSVRAEVQGYVVGLNSTLKYVNDGDNTVEVLFRFPVDESFAVVGMEAVIGGRKIKAEIKKKEEAREDYDSAMARGATAALGEEKSGDIFSISLGNLPAQAEAEIHLKLVGELPIDAEGGVRFTLPAVLKPRYTPVGSVDPLASAGGGGAQQGQAPAVYDFKMAVKSDEVSDITSPTHTISFDRDDGVFNVSLTGVDAQPLKKDLVVLIHHTEPHSPKVMFELGDASMSQSSYMGSPAVMLSFFPEFEVKRAAGEFIFLVDRSGSMRGSYIRSAGETLALFLKSLPPGCSFNIIGFGSHYTCLFRESVPYNQGNMEEAVRHAESLQADYGGTELLAPLSHVFKQRPIPGLPRQIFVLTDGSVSNTQSCIDEATKNANNSRVFTFGIGSGASTALVNGLAKAGCGTSEFIKEGERMQPKVIKSLKQALQPSVTDVRVEFHIPDQYKTLQAPITLTSIFNGDKTVVYGVFQKISDLQVSSNLDGSVLLKYVNSGKEEIQSLSFKIPSRETREPELACFSDTPVIHHLAAKSLIKDWENGKGEASTLLTHENKDAITSLSLEASVISKHTSLVAIGEESVSTNSTRKLFDIVAADDVRNRSLQQELLSSCRSASSSIYNYASFDYSEDFFTKTKRSFCFSSHNHHQQSATNYSPSSSKERRRRSRSRNRRKRSSSRSRSRSRNCSPVRAEPCRKYERRRSRSRNSSEGEQTGFTICDGESSSDSSSLIATPTGRSTNSTMYALISIQHARGQWELSELCQAVLHVAEEDTICPSYLSSDVWATILALTFLELHFSDKEEEWELVAEKANAWINGLNYSESEIARSKELAKDWLNH